MDPNQINQMPVPDNSTPIQGGTPYFMGENALVKFSSGFEGSNPATYWLVDKADNTVRPFESESALRTAFGEGYDMAIKNVMTLTPPNVDENNEIIDGVLQDFSILGPEYSVKEDGTSKKLRFSPSQLKKRYGKPINENGEGLAAEALDGFFNILKTKEGETKIPKNFIEQIKKNSQLMAFYISALAYGNYSLDNIYSDILKQWKSNSK